MINSYSNNFCKVRYVRMVCRQDASTARYPSHMTSNAKTLIRQSIADALPLDIKRALICHRPRLCQHCSGTRVLYP